MPDDVVTLADPIRDDEETEEQRVLRIIGWSMEYDRVARRCCGGVDWCNLDDPGCPVDEESGPYAKIVLGTMNLVARLNRAGATFMLRLPTLFRSRVRIARIVVDGQKRVAALKPCR